MTHFEGIVHQLYRLDHFAGQRMAHGEICPPIPIRILLLPSMGLLSLWCGDLAFYGESNAVGARNPQTCGVTSNFSRAMGGILIRRFAGRENSVLLACFARCQGSQQCSSSRTLRQKSVSGGPDSHRDSKICHARKKERREDKPLEALCRRKDGWPGVCDDGAALLP